jgi:hypothetical protein
MYLAFLPLSAAKMHTTRRLTERLVRRVGCGQEQRHSVFELGGGSLVHLRPLARYEVARELNHRLVVAVKVHKGRRKGAL